MSEFVPTPRVELPFIQVVYLDKDAAELYVNRDTKDLQLIARSLGKELIIRVNSEGNVVLLEGNADEISNAFQEFQLRIEKMKEIYKSAGK